MREKAEKTSNGMRQERKIIQIVLSSIIYGAVESWKIFFLFLISDVIKMLPQFFAFFFCFWGNFTVACFFTLNFFYYYYFFVVYEKKDKFHSLLLAHKFYLVMNYFSVLELMKKKRRLDSVASSIINSSKMIEINS